jgi:hypothetical protein
MALLAPQQVGITGTAPTFSAVAATDTVVPDDRAVLVVKNGNAGADSVTIVIPGNLYGQPRADVVISVPGSGGERYIGPFTPDMADPTTGLVTINHSVTATVTSALVRV